MQQKVCTQQNKSALNNKKKRTVTNNFWADNKLYSDVGVSGFRLLLQTIPSHVIYHVTLPYLFVCRLRYNHPRCHRLSLRFAPDSSSKSLGLSQRELILGGDKNFMGNSKICAQQLKYLRTCIMFQGMLNNYLGQKYSLGSMKI